MLSAWVIGWEICEKVAQLIEFFRVASYIKGATFLFEARVMSTLVYTICLGIMLGIFDYLEDN